ncbi:periplasmic heavy metal sensor [uncultured Roseovarius sp.]|uniref:periplasmic heavy metal sensor n=1 Tax=uncultured Roseovarius sp. TaxID=293344 RepID=UPI00261F70E6|nr:periplasmic heavy metal sensor [uncultured Roseovarius sp.]
MADETQATDRGTKRWVRVLLVFSLALNLLVLGTVGGAMLTWSKWRSHDPPRLDLAGGPLTQALTREDRRAIARQMRKTYRDNGGVPRADMKAELEALVRDLKADPFEPALVKKRLARHRGVFRERFALGQSLLLERLTQMQPKERVAYADRLLRALEKHSDRGRQKEGRE